MALINGELDEAVALCVERAGGGPNDYQFGEVRDGSGATRLQLAVAPEVEIHESEFVESVLRELAHARHPAHW